MTLIHVAGLAILLGCATTGLVWFGWGLIANLRATRATTPTEDTPEASGETDAAA